MIGVGADELAELSPFARRVADLDAGALVRVRPRDEQISLLARLPFGVLAGRTVVDARVRAGEDGVFGAQAFVDWVDNGGTPAPRLDASWHVGVPPLSGWRRIEAVPDQVVRELVRAGALALKDAASREGVPGAQPRSEVSDALLDSVVLTASDDIDSAAISLRLLSALTRMGFLARDSQAIVAVSGRWTRVSGAYGSVFAERPGLGLGLAPRR